MERRLAYIGIILVIATTAFFGYFITDLKFQYVFEDFFPTDDPDLQVYKRFREDFKDDNNYLLIALLNEPSVFDEEFFQNVDSLKDSLRRIKGAVRVNSILNASTPLITPTGLIGIPALHADDPSRYEGDSIRIFSNSWMVGSLISHDASSLLITVYHEEFEKTENTDAFVNEVKGIVASSELENHVVGKVYAQLAYVTKMQQELLIFLSLSIILVIAFLILAYRNFYLVIVPLVVVALSVVWLAGFMALTGKSLDLLMVLMPTILFVVGMSDVVHILSRFLEELRSGKPKIVALRITIKEIGLATFLTSFTTAVGFLTLLTASIAPVQDFGVYMAIGVLFAYIIAFTLLPSILFFLKIPTIAHSVKQKKMWNRNLRSLFIWVINRRKSIVIAAIALLVMSVVGISKIEINTYLIDDLPDSDPLKKSYSFFDDKYEGSRPFDALITVKDTTASIFDPEVIKEIQKTENIISSHLPTSQLYSPVFIIKTINQAKFGGREEQFILPENKKEWNDLRRYIRRISKRPESARLITEDLQKARITGRMDDIGSSITLNQIDNINSAIENQTNTDLISVNITGSSFLIDKNNEYLVRNMLQGLGIAFGVVALLAGIMFRSFRMIIIALLPNMLPLLIVAAMMGYTGITLKLSTSIVFTIAFGIAVDDTLHLLSKLRLELAKGTSLLYALKRSYISTGKALIVTSMILSGGFLILLFSSFGGTFYTGLLVGITLVLALIIDLTLLPILIIILSKYKKTLYRGRAFSNKNNPTN